MNPARLLDALPIGRAHAADQLRVEHDAIGSHPEMPDAALDLMLQARLERAVRHHAADIVIGDLGRTPRSEVHNAPPVLATAIAPLPMIAAPG